LDYKIREYNENIKKLHEQHDNLENEIADELIEKQETVMREIDRIDHLIFSRKKDWLSLQN